MRAGGSGAAASDVLLTMFYSCRCLLLLTSTSIWRQMKRRRRSPTRSHLRGTKSGVKVKVAETRTIIHDSRDSAVSTQTSSLLNICDVFCRNRDS